MPFTERQRMAIFEAQNGLCAICQEPLDEDNFHAHAILADHRSEHAGLALCPECHRKTLTYGRGGLRRIIKYYTG